MAIIKYLRNLMSIKKWFLGILKMFVKINCALRYTHSCLCKKSADLYACLLYVHAFRSGYRLECVCIIAGQDKVSTDLQRYHNR